MEAKDITGRVEIELLVNTFYEKVNKNKGLSPMFAEVHWETHLPVMYDFWENVMFHTGNYSGNPMAKHHMVHQKHPLTKQHFEMWLLLFEETVDDFFSGPNAILIKERARSIAIILEMKIIVPERNVL
ncbi:MAG: group III truncated hemoglobin [Saprospiraceae bacterium]|nr:group III truncated hemoglobin [Saprospiraceae bacterium]